MGFLFPLTQLIDQHFSFTSKPVICEFPTIPDHIFNKYTRAIRIAIAGDLITTLDVERSVETGQENYDLQIISTNYADAMQIRQDLRDGADKFKNEYEKSDYALVRLPQLDFSQDPRRLKWFAEGVVEGSRTGRVT